jgi:hypothetical protein
MFMENQRLGFVGASLIGVFVFIKVAIKIRTRESKNRILATSIAALVVPPKPRVAVGNATRSEEMIREDMGGDPF